MPWMEERTTDQRLKLVALHLDGEYTMTELAARFGVSRKTAYKWVGRYREAGPGGLADRSRAPHTRPGSVSDDVVEMLVEARRAHPTWGPRKLLAWLRRRHPDVKFPVPSTVGEIFRRYGLSKPHGRRRRVPAFTEPFGECTKSNTVWCADYKGQFRLGNGANCYPLTITDAFSRFILCCKALSGTKESTTRAAFQKVFREHGLPDAIRTDNGTPFASRGPLGLTTLSLWWLSLGITHERIKPGRPDQNGRHERMHRTLKAETTRPPQRSLRAQQRCFNTFVEEFNEERPHEALDNATPSSVYVSSDRRLPKRVPGFDYGDDCVVRKVHASGRVRWRKSRLMYVGRAFAGAAVGFVRRDEHLWEVYFQAASLGFVDERRTGLGLIWS